MFVWSKNAPTVAAAASRTLTTSTLSKALSAPKPASNVNALSYLSSAFSTAASSPSPSLSSSTNSTSVPASVSASGNVLAELRVKHARDIERLTEVIQAKKFISWLETHPTTPVNSDQVERIHEAGLDAERLRTLFRAAMMTFFVHVESRSASSVGQGFYTIGPCGEELMGAIALALRPTDSMALHYRHVATQVARQLEAGRSMDEILLDRARGHTVSATDPVTGGVHCAIGGGEYDFLVTSTLASQACPAVGRALATGLSHYMASQSAGSGITPLFPKDSVSVVSVGDGSANNGHFLSAINLAEYSAFRKFKCPTVFIVTDNDIAISLRGHGWMGKQWIKKLQMPLFEARGDDALAVYTATQSAVSHARSRGAPAFVYLHSIKRRFGHAATDRQAAYMSSAEIAALVDSNPLEGLANLLAESGIMSYAEMAEEAATIWSHTQAAFEMAAAEPKVSSREAMMDRVAVPRAPLPAHAVNPAAGAQAIPSAAPVIGGSETDGILTAPATAPGYALADRSKFMNVQTRNYESVIASKPPVVSPPPPGRDVMRKHMTRVFDELLDEYPQSVYIGEDVQHGGYYLVTDGLAAKYPGRVRDFPPDETSLLGVGVGMAQAGLLPIVEIPYAKYIDCGADMFFELALSSWLSETRQPNGMIVRLQGFGKGVFGGNFHTHNTIHTPPGVDVVCYSNGADYARGMRYAAVQAAHGRVVMSVDFTHLLNLRHVFVDDDGWRKPYTASNEMTDFDQVAIYPSTTTQGPEAKKIAFVTYGEGVITALQTRKQLETQNVACQVTVVDCPLLSRTPDGLRALFAGNDFDGVVFVDPCKIGHTPLSLHCSDLNDDGTLPQKWSVVGAQPTYNPLGSTLTFVSVDDVQKAVQKML